MLSVILDNRILAITLLLSATAQMADQCVQWTDGTRDHGWGNAAKFIARFEADGGN